ncbi:putative CMP/dCMP deaminase [Waddlia chondrophila 2032/99]|uniref:Putative CMP/dCMP deaminase n=2 Tax=Waddlia chondrophila TaxID=71667 RepID=D6YVU4_WADCW|nr:nucleoside deaminase [Waddlia chondrophila]ADI38255.1 putative CMP/dCMP deaminase [Waddlia chondrophila WSU 86-1044]CCB91336.1 putative CMP/dCMP deaminase [Waddlia chondrophila 2032/99]
MNNITDSECIYLERCLTLAEISLKSGDEPFASLLVNEKGEIIAEARNRINEHNVLAHPEIELAQWAANHLTRNKRKLTTMYTTGEHCPMCAAAHGLVGLGKIVYISSSAQLASWLKELNIHEPPINFIPIQEILPHTQVIGPIAALTDRVKNMHVRHYAINCRST